MHEERPDVGVMDEAILHYDNTEQLYRSSHLPWVQNVKRKLESGVYERSKLEPEMEKYLVPRIIDSYNEEFGEGSLKLDKQTKHALGVRLARKIESEAREEADFDKPYHQKKGRTFIMAHNGFDGEVDHPTIFLAGESGPEHVHIEPEDHGMNWDVISSLGITDVGSGFDVGSDMAVFDVTDGMSIFDSLFGSADGGKKSSSKSNSEDGYDIINSWFNY